MTYQVQPTEYTIHGWERGAQRRISPTDVDYVLGYGQKLRRYGADCFVLRRTDIPEDHLRYDQVSRLEGTVVVVSPENEIITAYRVRRRARLRKLLRPSRP